MRILRSCLGRSLHMPINPYFRLYSTQSRLIKSLIPGCHVCGSAFQSTDPDLPGFHNQINDLDATTSFKASKNKNIDKIFEGLDEDKKLFLAQDALARGTPGWSTTGISWSTSSGDQIEKSKADEKRKVKQEAKRCLCSRCLDIRTGFTPGIVQPYDDAEVLIKSIPSGATVVNVIDALDFPTTVLSERFLNPAGRRSGKIIWAINRVDLVVTKKFKAVERALPYFQEYLSEAIGAPAESVFTVSSKLDWHLNTLYSALGAENYFIGYTNSGKSTLALALAQRFAPPRAKPSAMQKYASNTMPWSTQASSIYELEAKKIVVDMPSIPENNNGTYGALLPSEVRKVSVGRQLLKDPSSYNIKRVVATRPHQVINIGGLVAVKRTEENPNDQVHLLAWGILRDSQTKVRVVKSVDKAIELGTTELDASQKDWNLVNESAASTLTKRSDYTFDGSGLSLAIRGIGVVHLHASGRIPPKGVTVSVYTADHVVLKRRPNILPYLRDTDDLEQRSEFLSGIKQVPKSLR